MSDGDHKWWCALPDEHPGPCLSIVNPDYEQVAQASPASEAEKEDEPDEESV